MTEFHLPQSAIEQDHRLEASTEEASQRLAQHRWHWTLDESNADRVSIREYARQVGRSQRLIQSYVTGYASWKVTTRASSLGEEIERAKVGVEKEAAIEAVAEARGMTFTNIRQRHGDDVRQVRDVARATAESKGTSVTDEIPEAARRLVATEESEAQQRVERQERHGVRWVEVDGHVAKAIESLRRARIAASGVPFDDEERDLLRNDLHKVIAIAQLIDSQLVGTVLDWDAELTKIMEGVN